MTPPLASTRLWSGSPACSKPFAAVVTATALFILTACSGGAGGGEGETTGRAPTDTRGVTKDAEAEGPAPEVEGAVKGGTITVYLPLDPGPTDLDPTNWWSATGNSIQQGLVNRSLTQYKRGEDGETILVPDLATDLGTPNADFTEWTFTIKDDVTWETGDPVTAEEVAFGIIRSLDSTEFPMSLGTDHSKPFFLDGDTYKGPYTAKGKPYRGVTFDADANTVTIKMAKPYPDMDYWGSVMAMGPIPLGEISDPPAYGKDPLATGPYKVESFRPGEELVLVRNDQWDPASDPARHQYADSFVFKFNQDQAQVDEMMLGGNYESQTAVSGSLGADSYTVAEETLGDRLVLQGTQCISTLTPDYTRITEIEVRKALAYAYPYEDAWLATGQIPDVTRIPANSYMPPGMAGKREFFADGEPFTFNPIRSKELLAEAGYQPGEYEITMLYRADPVTAAGQKQIKLGFEEGGFRVTEIPIPATDDPYSYWLDPDNKINKRLNLRQINWCADWPSGAAHLPFLLRTGAAYNTAYFSEQEVDEEMDRIATLPLAEQPDAWGALDELVSTKYFPSVVTGFRNDLFTFGERIGSPAGLGSIGAPYYQDLFVRE